MPSPTRACAFRHGCIGIAQEASPFCAVHQPDKVLDRAVNVVFNNFAAAIAASGAATAHLLRRLHDDIVHDLKETV